LAGDVVPANIVEEPTMSSRRRRRIRAAVVVTVVTLAAMAWVALGSRSGLSADELFSLATATGHSLEHPAAIADERLGDWVDPATAMPAEYYRRYLAHDDPPATRARVIRAVRLSDTSPPLYYLLLHYWTRLFGTGDGSVRVFSVVCALGTFPGLIHLARRAGGPPAIVPASILFATSPAVVAYSTEARMYALVWLLASALGALTLMVARRRSHGITLVLWVVTGALGLLTHYFFAFVWAACVAWLALHRARWRAPAFWAAVLATAAIVAPWYVTIPASLGQWRVTAGWLDGRLGRRGMILGPVKLAWGLVSGQGDWDQATSVRWLLTAVLLLLATALVRRTRRRALAAPRVLLWLCVLAAALGPLLFDLVLGTRTTLFARYALAGLPAALALTATALARVGLGWRVALLVLLVAAALPADWAMYTEPSRHGHSFRQIAVDLREAGPPGEIVGLVHSIPSGVLGVSRYADPDVPIASWVGQLRQRRVPESVKALIAGASTVVFVQIHAVGEPAPEGEWLRSNSEVLGETRRGRAEIVIFRPHGIPDGRRSSCEFSVDLCRRDYISRAIGVVLRER
jgi:hypothetical protein